MLKINNYSNCCFHSPFKILRQNGNAFLQTRTRTFGYEMFLWHTGILDQPIIWDVTFSDYYWWFSTMFQHIRSLNKMGNVSIVKWVNEARYFRKKKLSSAIIMMKYNHGFWPQYIFSSDHLYLSNYKVWQVFLQSPTALIKREDHHITELFFARCIYLKHQAL